MYDYAIRFEQDDSAPGVAVFCRDLPELNSFGDDREGAISQAVDAVETTLSLYVDARKPIPAASPPEEGEYVVHLPAVTVAKIALWNEMMRRGMRKADLCRRLELSQTQGDRLVDFLHNTKMESLEKALDFFGLRVRVRIERDKDVERQMAEPPERGKLRA
ncbi:type II toxin-antitoxin system HicB family antitoxin [Pseudomonas aeruginosa]|uniref:type II toxin-antitoxin system HicB family antitoxin n=1 Tax=Pseudomonas aeruginosa TaxID=287 RepID=UPI0018C692C7|nr:type II toxin-antitoxin system HicB family antitoxin [Pseudomonas aeruginosa]MBG4395186.1 type II toxin-antitoxin system HicB family antitoxin [Pseudomonas aeruginosa]MDY1584175.1 type II toxin-antitoxin system HicB family antitoxin [Pseudomonas aeruginosa]HCE5817620.1 type II toxin-antitoxin system HicB family antitoxin [Pseudomonas aeruginosa]HCL3802844.1 type II toxin-antitoxin system HicB family antitoxin [Pseudomonas aeruginosa]HEJ3239693.1 type II toxin-antitoxin system HicB family an